MNEGLYSILRLETKAQTELAEVQRQNVNVKYRIDK